MEQNNKLHLTIEMDLDPDALVKNSVTLERVLDWVKVSSDAVVDRLAVKVSAPAECAGAEQMPLPAGFFVRKLDAHQDAIEIGVSVESYEVTCPGSPFSFIKDDDDVVRFVESLMRHTENHWIDDAAENYWSVTVGKCETNLFRACCFFLLTNCCDSDHNLPNVLKLLRCGYAENDAVLPQNCALDILFRDLAEREPDNAAVSAFHSFLFDAGIKAAQQALHGCVYRLEHMTLSQLNDIMEDMSTV